LEHVLAVLERRALGGEREHRLLGRVERRDAGRKVGAAVLHAPAEDLLEEGGGHLVVLLVRRLRLDGERSLREALDERLLPAAARREVARALLGEPPGAEAADRRPHDRVGHEAALRELL